MSILNRLSTVIQAKILHVVDNAEDPRETLDYAVERQQDLLGDVRRALVEVRTSRYQLSAQLQRFEQRHPQPDDPQLQLLRRQLEEVTQEEEKLRLAERRFTTAVEVFRTRRDVLSARYTAAEAQYEASRSLAGLSGELTDLGSAVRRAESKIDRMQAQAAAIDQFLEELEQQSGTKGS